MDNTIEETEIVGQKCIKNVVFDFNLKPTKLEPIRNFVVRIHFDNDFLREVKTIEYIDIMIDCAIEHYTDDDLYGKDFLQNMNNIIFTSLDNYLPENMDRNSICSKIFGIVYDVIKEQDIQIP